MGESELNAALRHFEAVEANLVKIEKLLTEIHEAIPEGVVFGDNPEYENNCRAARDIWDSLPKINEWKPAIGFLDLDEIAQTRLDADEIGEIEMHVSLGQQINEPFRLLREYRFRFNKKRRELIRESVGELVDAIDDNLRNLLIELRPRLALGKSVDNPVFDELKNNVDQIDSLLGSSVSRPAGWTDLRRHLHFGMIADLRDIVQNDWPTVKSGLRKSLYGEKEPFPVEINDLEEIVGKHPKGQVATKLRWDHLSDEDFERLIFALISSEKGYENPEWLTKTKAPDRGRDLSVVRVINDPLGGTSRYRVIIQCKHWLTKSITPTEVATLREQMKIWEPPRIDVQIIATSGRFTSDAVAIIEKHNLSDSALRIEMWPESHLERLLASRPAIIAEFSLR